MIIPSKIKRRYEAWWNHSLVYAPLLWYTSLKDASEALQPETPFVNAMDAHIDVRENALRYRNYLRTHAFHGDAFPCFDVNLGAGSMALYLGCEPDFAWDTIWFKECLGGDWEQKLPQYDPNNPWLKLHINMVKEAVRLLGDQCVITIPDIVENLDILSAMRGPQQLCYDLIDSPDAVHAHLDALDDLYFTYYDAFYNLTKDENGDSMFTAFKVRGGGKTAKLQCDFAALMSPKQFREYIVPSLTKQCAKLNHSVYHLDGVDEIRHLDALMSIDRLQAIQWTHGAGKPDGLHKRWFAPVYDIVTGAGKSLELIVDDCEISQLIDGINRLLDRYTAKGILLILGKTFTPREVDIFAKATEKWK